MPSSDTLTRPDIEFDLEAMFSESIPCGRCPQPARLRSFGHEVNDCGENQPGGEHPPYYMCHGCYAAWLTRTSEIITRFNAIRCMNCNRLFNTPDEFSNYREF